MARISAKYYSGGDYYLLYNENNERVDNNKYVYFKGCRDGLDKYYIVKQAGQPFYQYMDVYGRLSDKFSDCDNYINGKAVVRNLKGKYQIIDKDWKLSEEFAEAHQCQDGAVIVRKEFKDKYQLHATSGEVSDPFAYISKEEFAGHRIIQENSRGPFRVRKPNGVLSTTGYRSATPFDSYGFAKILKVGCDNRYYYVDLLGRISKDLTPSGYDFGQFLLGKKEPKDMDPEDFEDPIFCNGIINAYRERYKKEVEYMHAHNTTISLSMVKGWLDEAKEVIDTKRKELESKTTKKEDIIDFLKKEELYKY